jgi:hypothetical protein
MSFIFLKFLHLFICVCVFLFSHLGMNGAQLVFQLLSQNYDHHTLDYIAFLCIGINV